MTEELIEQKVEEKSKQAFCVAHTHEDELIFRSGFIEGYHECQKANEWHYPAKGELPKDENYVLVSNGKDWTKGFYKDNKWNIISLVGFTNIIAWKEIVPPSLDKEKSNA